MRDKSQVERILAMLRYWGAKGVCGTTFLRIDDPIARYAARIHDLRSQGHDIETVPCRNFGHTHKSAQVRYILQGWE